MKPRTLFQVGLPIALAVILFAVFPATLRFVEGAAISLLRFWWVLLAFGLIGWVVWMLQKRNP